MAEIIKKQTWNGLLVESVTDTSTGVITIRRPYQNKPGEFLFEYAKSDPKVNGGNWNYINQEVFRLDYNRSKRSQGFQETSQPEFNSLFYTQGFNEFNETRGDVLNDLNNYSSVDLSERSRSTYAQVYKIPYVKDPVTGQVVSSRGQLSSQPNTGPQLQPETQEPDAQVPILPPEGVDVEDPYTDEGLSYNKLSDTNKSLTSTKVGGGKGVTLRYPLLEPPEEFGIDYIRITAYDYVPSISNENLNITNGFVNTTNSTQYETIYLPMQPKLTESNQVNWSDDTLNPVKKVLGEFALANINSIGSADFGGIVNNTKDLFDTVRGLTDDPNLKQFISAYFAGQAVGANLVGRTSGMVINPNLELLFNGPTLRTFNFNFRFTPRFEKESEEIRKIIRAFKRNSLPQRTSSNLFLRSPRVFELEYVYMGNRETIGEAHPYLNQFKPCALTNLSIDYTPDGSYMTFGSTGSLTSYDVSLSFTELQPNYADQIGMGTIEPGVDKLDDTGTTMGF